MDTRTAPGSFGHDVWYSIHKIANDFKTSVEEVRIGAETFLDLSVYDPTLDMISDRGRRQLRDLFNLGLR